MRRIFFTAVLFTLTALFFCGCAYGDAAIYRGSKILGAVPVIENKSGLCVPIADVGELLGFTASRGGDELLLRCGNITLRIINNSAAAWRGISLVALQSEVFKSNGVLWVDSASVVSLFQPLTGTGAANKLRFSKISGYSASLVKNDLEFGSFEEEKKPDPVPLTRTGIISPAKEKPAQVIANLPSVPATQTPKPVTVTQASNSVSASASKVKTQPKYELFKINDSKTETEEIYNGVIEGVRWTSTEGANNKKIRAVFMVNRDAEPQVYMDNKQLHALFSSTLEKLDSLKSPYENVKLEAKTNTDGIELIFTAPKIVKAEKIVLSNPRRIIFDFFFTPNTNIQKEPEKTQPAKIPTPTPTPTVTPIVTTPKVPETPKTVQPQLTLPSSNPQNVLVIPLKQGARKTIVVDPGHGGKDPGASDNGVVEKNVNLAIGLELEKVLTSRGYKIIMTRNTDVYLKLQERTDIANNANADLFVSIHVNALPNKKSMTGFEIYIMALPTDKDAMNLAKIENREYVEGKGIDTENVDRRTEMLLRILGDMQQNNKISESTEFAAALYNAGVRNNLPMRRVAQAPFFVLRGAGMPAVLLETGFVTNANEAHLLTTQAYQSKIANAMAEGIINYLR